MHQHIENSIERRLRRAPFGRIRSFAIEPVFDDVQILRAQIDAAEIIEAVIDHVELALLIGLAAAAEQIFRALENPAVELVEIGPPARDPSPDRNRKDC